MTETRRVPRLVPLLNRLAKPLLSAGVPMGFNGLLTVRGRRSGEPRTTPLAIIEVGGRRWVWSPWGEVQWVHNLRAAGQATIEVRREEADVRAIELDPTQRATFFRETLAPLARSMRGGITFIRLLDGVDLDDPSELGDGHPVFELRPMT